MKQIIIAGSISTFIGCGCASSEAMRYVCEFQTFSDYDGLQQAKDFAMEFTYDPLTEDAFLTGNLGVSRVLTVEGGRAISFLEFLSSGAVQSTTIAANGAAVHSRHTIIGEDLVPSQYYGSCQKP